MGSYCLTNAEFQFGGKNMEIDGCDTCITSVCITYTLISIANAFTATEYTLKVVKMVNFMSCIFYHNLRSEK